MITKKKLICAIKGSRSIVTNVANSLEVTRQAVYDALKKFPDCSVLLADEKDKLNTKARNVIGDAIDAKDVSTAKWYLGTTDQEFRQKQDIELVSGDIAAWKKYREERFDKS